MKRRSHSLQKALLFCALVTVSVNSNAQNITTIAGGVGDTYPAALFGRIVPTDMAMDAAGNMYIADERNCRIRKVDPAGNITTIAGTGVPGYDGDGGPAIYARLKEPTGVAIDLSGNIYFSDQHSCIRKIDGPTGVIYTIAGSSTVRSFSGDGNPSTYATFDNPTRLALDGSGCLYIADIGNNRIRKINSSGVINTVAGGGSSLGDGGTAITAGLNQPTGIDLDGAGNLYIADRGNHRIRKVDNAGIITTIAGNGAESGSSSSTAKATALNAPTDVKVDADGNVYFSNRDDAKPYLGKVTTAGGISFISGTSRSVSYGWGGAMSYSPGSVELDTKGNIYVFDGYVRKIDSKGNMSRYAGNELNVYGLSGDGKNGILGLFDRVTGITADVAGNVYFSDPINNRIRKISSDGILSTYAGNNGIVGFGGDGGPSTAAIIHNPQGMTADGRGNIYFADYGTNHVRKIDAAGIISTIAGGGGNIPGDGGAATDAKITVNGIGADAEGNIYIADGTNATIRKVDAITNIITTIAGGGTSDFSNGIPATAVKRINATSVAVDTRGNIYIAAGSVCKIDAAGIIYAIPGPMATSLAIDRYNSVYSVYTPAGYSTIINKIDTDNVISVVAGNNIWGYAGDDGPATAACLKSPTCIAFDAAGNMVFADMENYAIRKVCAGACAKNMTTKVQDVVTKERKNEWTLFPNPANTEVAIKWNNQKGEQAVVTISDMAGRKVLTSSIRISSASGEEKLNLQAVKAGMYIVNIRSASTNYSGKLVITD